MSECGLLIVKRNDNIAQVQERLMTILEHWASRGVYAEQYVHELKSLVAGQQPKSSGVSDSDVVRACLCLYLSHSFKIFVHRISTYP